MISEVKWTYTTHTTKYDTIRGSGTNKLIEWTTIGYLSKERNMNWLDAEVRTDLGIVTGDVSHTQSAEEEVFFVLFI